MVLDGVMLQHEELAGVWDVTVFLDVGKETEVKRIMARDGRDPDLAGGYLQRHGEAHKIYRRVCKPQARAAFLVDNEEFEAAELLRGPRKR